MMSRTGFDVELDCIADGTFHKEYKTLKFEDYQAQKKRILKDLKIEGNVPKEWNTKTVSETQIKAWLKGYGKRPLNVAGLVFPLARHHRYLKRRLLTRVSKTAAVCVAATLEYLTAEILELAGNAAKDCKTHRISPRHIMLAVRGDEELNEVFPGTIQSGGVVPNIHQLLVKKKKGAKA
jgi:histone H2A